MAFPFVAVEEMLLAFFCVCDFILVAISLPALLKTNILRPLPTFAMFLATFSFAVFTISVILTAYSHVRTRYPISRRNLRGTWTFGILLLLALVAIIHASIRITQVGICADYDVLPSSCAFGAISLAVWCLIALTSLLGTVVCYLHVEPAFKITPFPQATVDYYAAPSYPQRTYQSTSTMERGHSVEPDRFAIMRK